MKVETQNARLALYLRPSEIEKLDKLAENACLSRTGFARTVLRREIKKAEEAEGYA